MSRSRIARTRTRLRRATAACATLALAAAISACGDDDPQPTADYPAVADEICLDVAEQLTAESGDQGPSKSPEDAVELLEIQIPIRQDGLERLQALRPPPELVAASDSYLTILEGRVDALDQALTAAKDEDADAYLAAQQRFERLSDKMRGVGEQAGFEACAEVLPPAGQEDVLAAVEKLLTSQDSKKVCDELVTERFAKDAYGSAKECETERGFPTAVSLELLDVGGVGATSAFVDVEVVDFFGSTRQQRIGLVFVDKRWRIDNRENLEEPEEPGKGEEGRGESAPSDDQSTTTTPEDEQTTTTEDTTVPE